MSKRLAVCVSFVFIFVMVVCGISQSAEKVMTLQFSNNLPATEVRSVLFEKWAKDVEQKTNGRLKIYVSHGGTLTSPMQTFDSVSKGTIDIGYGLLGYTAGRFPLMEAVEYPYGIKNYSQSTAMGWAFYKKFDPKELSKVKVLMLGCSQSFGIHSRKPIKTLEDLKGMKIRTSGPGTARILKALGAVPVVLNSGDVYDALQKNVVEGVLTENDALDVFKFGEVTQYTVQGYQGKGFAGGGTAYVVMNKDLWSSLPPDIQKIIEDESAAINAEWVQKVGAMQDAARKKWEAKGHKFIDLSNAEHQRWTKALTPVFDEFVKEKSGKGLPAADAISFLRDWAKKNVK